MVSERRMFVEAVAAEVAHEIVAATNYFRMLTDRSLRGNTSDHEDWQLARQELARLDELLQRLRRMAAHRLVRSPTSLAELVEALRGPRWEKFTIDVDPDVRIVCDPARLAIALRALAENALDAAAPDGAAGLEWRADARAPVLRVWASAALDPDADGGHRELAVTVARRTVRAHGWSLESAREGARTCTTIQLRAEDVLP